MINEARRGPIDLPEEFWTAPPRDQQALRTVVAQTREARRRLDFIGKESNLDVWEYTAILFCYNILANRGDPKLQNPLVDNFLLQRLSAFIKVRAIELSEENKKSTGHLTDQEFLTYCMNYAQGLYDYLHPQSGGCDPRITAKFVQEVQAVKMPVLKT